MKLPTQRFQIRDKRLDNIQKMFVVNTTHRSTRTFVREFFTCSHNILVPTTIMSPKKRTVITIPTRLNLLNILQTRVSRVLDSHYDTSYSPRRNNYSSGSDNTPAHPASSNFDTLQLNSFLRNVIAPPSSNQFPLLEQHQYLAIRESSPVHRTC